MCAPVTVNMTFIHAGKGRPLFDTQGLQFLQNDETKTRYPAGTSPLRCSDATAELGNVWSSAPSQEVTLSIKFEKNTSRKEALHRIHRMAAQ